MVDDQGTQQQQFEQIHKRVDWLATAGYDFISTENGYSEFTHPDDIQYVLITIKASIYLLFIAIIPPYRSSYNIIIIFFFFFFFWLLLLFVRMLSWMNELTNYTVNTYPNKRVYIKVHCSTGQTCKDFKVLPNIPSYPSSR